MKTRLLLISLLLAALIGCAKLPESGGGDSTVRVLFRWTTDGEIVNGQGAGGGGLPYLYFIVLNLSKDANPITQGPIPVTASGGNGYVAGDATHMILWDPLRSPEFSLWKFQDEELLTITEIDIPVNYRSVQTGDRTFEVEIDLSQLVPGEVDDIKNIQVNFLSMNRLSTSGGGTRDWDALGDSRVAGEVNSPFTFSTLFSRLYSDAIEGDIEPAGDALDPGVDFVDWEIEVRTD
jgi:hypothetical protein